MEGDEFEEYEEEEVVGMALGAQVSPPVEQEGGDTIMCWSGRPVVNSRILVVEFDDGASGMVHKQSSFKPRHGLVMEVRRSEEEGFYELVGDYRDNGVRLDK